MKHSLKKAIPAPVVDDEFNNEALVDIMNSVETNDLDAREIRRTSVWNDPPRKSLGPPKRMTLTSKPVTKYNRHFI